MENLQGDPPHDFHGAAQRGVSRRRRRRRIPCCLLSTYRGCLLSALFAPPTKAKHYFLWGSFCNTTTLVHSTYYHGWRTPNEAFFHWNLKLLCLDRQIGQIDLGPFGAISTHFGTASPLSMFSIIPPLFLQKTKPLYSHPKYFFGIWILGAKN